LRKHKRTPEQNRERREKTPGNRGKGSRICKRCGSLPHRVICCDGPTCVKCGLAYAPEKLEAT
jgi:hypothetical protein